MVKGGHAFWHLLLDPDSGDVHTDDMLSADDIVPCDAEYFEDWDVLDEPAPEREPDRSSEIAMEIWQACCDAKLAETLELSESLLAIEPKIKSYRPAMDDQLNSYAHARQYKLELSQKKLIHCDWCKYHKQENASRTPRHISWKDKSRLSRQYEFSVR